MIKKQMKIIADKIKNINDAQDGSFSKYYHQALKVLGISLESTNEYFKTASKEEAYWLCCTWEELFFKFKSLDLINLFLELQIKYPKIAKYLDADIESAMEATNYAR